MKRTVVISLIVTTAICICGILAWHFLSNFHSKKCLYCHPNTVKGRDVIVQMFEWRFDDIAKECEQFLGPNGYGAVQLSPVNEYAVIQHPSSQPVVTRPWWERYQPVSYKIISRSGDEAEFAKMASRCNKVGVRIYVDVVLNHMTANIGKGVGIGGSYYDSELLDYRGVPYNAAHFHTRESCGTKTGEIEDFTNATQARLCKLLNLKDLDQAQEYVRERIVNFLNALIGHGVAGFRVDASKHMHPADLKVILQRLQPLSNKYFPPKSKPFVYHEVIYYGGPGPTSNDYTEIGRVCEFRFAKFITNALRSKNSSLTSLRELGRKRDMLQSAHAQIFVENHDTQRYNIPDELSYRTPKLLKLATAFMLAWPYGVPRVLSGYAWRQQIENGEDKSSWVGPPHEENFEIKHTTMNNATSCSNGWICEHRWPEIYRMVEFRNVVGDSPVANWWDNGANQIAFSRGTKGFLAINNENTQLKMTVVTGLPPGTYCDIISGYINGQRCTGKVISVSTDGTALVDIDPSRELPAVATHTNAKLSS